MDRLDNLYQIARPPDEVLSQTLATQRAKQTQNGDTVPWLEHCLCRFKVSGQQLTITCTNLDQVWVSEVDEETLLEQRSHSTKGMAVEEFFDMVTKAITESNLSFDAREMDLVAYYRVEGAGIKVPFTFKLKASQPTEVVKKELIRDIAFGAAESAATGGSTDGGQEAKALREEVKHLKSELDTCRAALDEMKRVASRASQMAEHSGERGEESTAAKPAPTQKRQPGRSVINPNAVRKRARGAKIGS